MCHKNFVCSKIFCAKMYFCGSGQMLSVSNKRTYGRTDTVNYSAALDDIIVPGRGFLHGRHGLLIHIVGLRYLAEITLKKNIDLGRS